MAQSARDLHPGQLGDPKAIRNRIIEQDYGQRRKLPRLQREPHPRDQFNRSQPSRGAVAAFMAAVGIAAVIVVGALEISSNTFNPLAAAGLAIVAGISIALARRAIRSRDIIDLRDRLSPY